ncbi:hypothetical protein ABEY57_29355 [Bacillus tropicus]|uniref:hypothetical protein n=1 Tax=Bacillus cereus group TaxID=86661 RepID=UPI000BF62A66|nr:MULTISPECIES: hypothetical protein [Bacillus cereus group]PET31651.1 hypothetical protein CN518_17845 [Bacillus anthracis]PGV34586.1 hypothetical protein COD75_18310 [Bacillus anthracis]PHC82216.1 hypothetical protein COF42_27205 [Bacillus wiedmannii]
MKKTFGACILSGVLLSSGLTVSAEEQPTIKKFESVENINGEKVEVNGVEGSSSELTTEGYSTYAAGDRKWSVTNNRPFLGNWYTVASASGTYAHDKMGARARLFNKSGTLWASDNQSLSKVKSITATAKSSTTQANFNGAYSIGNFTFERAGYQNTYPELRNNW